MLGASGAIGAVIAGYVSLYPMRRISTLIPIVVFPLFLQIPAFVFVLEWFLLNLFHGIGALGFHPDASGGVAWWAHVGGFLSGLLFVRLLFPRRDDDRDDGGGVIVRGDDGKRYLTSQSQPPENEDRFEMERG